MKIENVSAGCSSDNALRLKQIETCMKKRKRKEIET